MDELDGRLDALWAEYRESLPDPDPANFLPRLWRKIEDRRKNNTIVFSPPGTDLFHCDVGLHAIAECSASTSHGDRNL